MSDTFEERLTMDRVCKPVELTPEQEKKWNDTCSMMVWTCPGFQHLFYTLLNNNDGKHVALFTEDVPIAATDGLNIALNPKTYFEMTLPERVFVLVHEIMHNMLDDVRFMHMSRQKGNVTLNDGSTLPFDKEFMNIAQDFRINATLHGAKIGAMPRDKKTGKYMGCFDEKMDGTESQLDLYKKVYKKRPKGGQSGGEGDGDGQGEGFDIILAPGSTTGKNPHQAAQARNQQRWATEIKAAEIIQASRSQGKMAAGLTRMFKEILEPEVDWRNHIHTLINRVTGSGGWNWRHPDEWWVPHDFFSPRRTGKGAGWIVIWGDTSGSRSDADIASNIAELAGIIEDVNPARLTVVWCDAEVTEDSIDELDEATDLTKLKPKGGGGTEVEPVFDWIRSNPDGLPDLFIGFTDGYVGFPTPPRVPIIWASSTDVKYPYGDVVRVRKGANDE